MSSLKRFLFSILLVAHFNCLGLLQFSEDNKNIYYNNNQLYALNNQMITMDYSRAYMGQKLTYQAVPFYKLFQASAIKKPKYFELICKDNFSVYVPSQLLLETDPKKSHAMLAIEPASKWPLLKNHTHTTAGPYALIWTDPEKSHISDEYWAWSIIAIAARNEIQPTFAISKPNTTNKPIQQGYKIFLSHCAGCHTLNHRGAASIGPDLTPPKSPLDLYPSYVTLRKFIRDPNSVNPLPKRRMSGSSYTGLNSKELDQLVLYFKHIKSQYSQITRPMK